MNISPRKLMLALLYAEGITGEKEPIEGITRMEKLVFLLTSEDFKEVFDELHYKANNYGPFSDKLVDQLENLVDLKLIEKTKGCNPEVADEFNYYLLDVKIPDKFALSPYGKALAKKIFIDLTDDERKKIISLKKKFNSIPLDALLSFIYNTIPAEYMVNSKIKEKYVKD